MNPKELLAKSPFTGRKAVFPDGFTFYQKKDDTWVDNLDPDRVDMSWDSTESMRRTLVDDEGLTPEEAESIMNGTWEPSEETAQTMRQWYQPEAKQLARAVLDGESPREMLKRSGKDLALKAHNLWREAGEADLYTLYISRGGITRFKISPEDAIKLNKEHGVGLAAYMGDTNHPVLVEFDSYYTEMESWLDELGIKYELYDEDTEDRYDNFHLMEDVSPRQLVKRRNPSDLKVEIKTEAYHDPVAREDYPESREVVDALWEPGKVSVGAGGWVPGISLVSGPHPTLPDQVWSMICAIVENHLNEMPDHVQSDTIEREDDESMPTFTWTLIGNLRAARKAQGWPVEDA